MSGCRRAGYPCPRPLGAPLATLLATPLKRHSSAGSRAFFLFCPLGWGGVWQSEPLTSLSSHLRFPTRPATLRSEADKHFICLFVFLSSSTTTLPTGSVCSLSANTHRPLFSFGKRRCISISWSPPSHDTAVQPILKLKAPCRHQHPQPLRRRTNPRTRAPSCGRFWAS